MSLTRRQSIKEGYAEKLSDFDQICLSDFRCLVRFFDHIRVLLIFGTSQSEHYLPLGR